MINAQHIITISMNWHWTGGDPPCSHPRYKDVFMRDMNDVDIETMSSEALADNHTRWRNMPPTPRLLDDG